MLWSCARRSRLVTHFNDKIHFKPVELFEHEPLSFLTPNHHPVRVAGLRVRTTRLTTTTQARQMSGEMSRE
jgi:hypothetical protein